LPKSLHDKLYEIAKSELRAAKILTKDGSYPQAIYFYAQAFEKAAKSAIALYLISYEKKSESQTSRELKNNYSHGLLKLTSFGSKIFVDSGIKSYVKRGGQINDEEIQIAIKASSIPHLETLTSDKLELISNYESSVRKCHRLYTKLKERPFLGSERPEMELLRELYKNPKSKHIKFNTLTRILFPILEGMDVYTRYPMEDIGYNNIAFLRQPEVRGACLLLGEMVGELIRLVPLVWEKIESLAEGFDSLGTDVGKSLKYTCKEILGE
jgi:hypothetical protein